MRVFSISISVYLGSFTARHNDIYSVHENNALFYEEMQTFSGYKHHWIQIHNMYTYKLTFERKYIHLSILSSHRTEF